MARKRRAGRTHHVKGHRVKGTRKRRGYFVKAHRAKNPPHHRRRRSRRR